MGDLADRLTGRRREVLAVLAVDRGDPVAADEVLVPVFDLHRAARPAWGLECRGLLCCCHVARSPSRLGVKARKLRTGRRGGRFPPRLAIDAYASAATRSAWASVELPSAPWSTTFSAPELAASA